MVIDVDDPSASVAVDSVTDDGGVVWDVIFFFSGSIIEMEFRESREEGVIILAIFGEDWDFSNVAYLG